MIFRPLTDEETKLFDEVIKKVEEREKLEDSYKDHRTGGTDAIKGAIKEIKKDIDGIKAGTTDPERIKALLWGLGQYLDPKTQAEYARASKSPQKPGSVSGYAGAAPAKGVKPATEGDWKCNKFVADSYATGAGVGLSTGDDWGGKNNVTGKGFPASKGDTGTWGPQANDLAKEGENLRSLTGAKEADVAGTGADPKKVPQPGDVLAFPGQDGSLGHSTIYLGNGLVISARGTGVEIGTVSSVKKSHGDSAKVRKFTGNGK